MDTRKDNQTRFFNALLEIQARVGMRALTEPEVREAGTAYGLEGRKLDSAIHALYCAGRAGIRFPSKLVEGQLVPPPRPYDAPPKFLSIMHFRSA